MLELILKQLRPIIPASLNADKTLRKKIEAAEDHRNPTRWNLFLGLPSPKTPFEKTKSKHYQHTV